jgi:hypothetical protein
MSKNNGTETNGAHGAEETDHAHHHPAKPKIDPANQPDDIMAKVLTVGVIGVAAALWEVALIPGMIIGAGAMLVPAILPKLADGVQPMFRWAVRGAYNTGQKARHAFAEAQEQVHDIVAEANADAVRPPAA